MKFLVLKSEESPQLSDGITIPKGWKLPQWMRELADSGDKTAKDIARMWDSGDIRDRKSAYRRTIKNIKEAGTPDEAKELFIQAKREGLERILRVTSQPTDSPLK